MTIQSIEKALKPLEVESLTIICSDGSCVDVTRHGDDWTAVFWPRDACRVAFAPTFEQALRRAVRLARVGAEEADAT